MRPLIAIVLLLVFVTASALAAAEERRVGGALVSPAEFDFYRTLARSETPGTPTEHRILYTIARDRAIQLIAVEQGILEVVSDFSALGHAFREENRRRRDLKERGEVFYGPVQYRKDVWFGVWFDQLRKVLERDARARDFPDLPRPDGEARARAAVAERVESAATQLLNSSISKSSTSIPE